VLTRLGFGCASARRQKGEKVGPVQLLAAYFLSKTFLVFGLTQCAQHGLWPGRSGYITGFLQPDQGSRTCGHLWLRLAGPRPRPPGKGPNACGGSPRRGNAPTAGTFALPGS
jgi:hypothetical protein